MPRGFLLILSGPSGSGKSTICRRLRRRDRSLAYSVSCCTRPPRPSETDGVHYHFMGAREFMRMARRGDLLEWAKVHGNYYGTPRGFVERETSAGRVVLLDIDVQGTEKVRRRLRGAVTVFLFPPSMGALRRRLQLRRDTQDSLQTRLDNALGEMRKAARYDYWVVNDSLDTAVEQVEAVIAAERLRPGRNGMRGVKLPGLSSLREVQRRT